MIFVKFTAYVKVKCMKTLAQKIGEKKWGYSVSSEVV